jgi:hypothetical protein
MEKYVKLQDVYDLLNKMAREPRYQHEDEDYYSGVAQVAGELVGVPAIELEGSKVGEWIKAPCSEKDGDATCSVCRHWDWSDCKYCSNCGAKMIKEN